MTTNQTTTAVFGNSNAIALWLNRSIEGLWLLTVVLVPLAFLDRGLIYSEAAIAYLEVPKIALLRMLVGLMTVLWLIEWGLLRGRFPIATGFSNRETRFKPSTYLARLRDWLSAQPTRWVILAAWFFALSTLLSTIFSASIRVSLWGEVPGQDGLSAYTLVAYLLLFGIITSHLKTRPQLWRLLSAVVAMGVVAAGFAVLQHYGYDPMGALEGTGGGQARVTSTVGNAVFAGALMLIPIAISTMLAAISLEKVNAAEQGKIRWRPSMPHLLITGGWTLILSIQFLGIVFTFSRGPWLGTMLALLVFLLLTILMAVWRTFVWASLMVGLAALLTFAILQAGRDIVPQLSSDSAPQAAAVEFGPTAEPIDSSVADVTERITSISGEVASGGLSNRVNIWKGSLTLMRDHPWFEFDDLSLPWLRPLVGYGPDLFRYTYLLVSVPLDARLLPAEPDHAHSFIVNQGVEQGVLGLLSASGIFLAVFVVAGYQLIRRSGGYSRIHKLAFIGLVAAISGRFLEQLVGVTRVSDLMLFWVILAVFAALPIVMQPQENAESSTSQEPNPMRTRRGRNARPTQKPNTLDLQTFIRLAIVAWAVGGIMALTWVKTVSYPRAAIAASQGIAQFRQGNFQASLASMDRATQLAPDVPEYFSGKASIYTGFLRHPEMPPEQECSLELNDITYQNCLVQNIHFNNILGSEQRPFNWRARLSRANSALALGLDDEAIGLYQEVVYMVPAAWPLHNRLAEAYIDIGQPEMALKVLEGSLAVTGDTNPSTQAVILQGLARKALEGEAAEKAPSGAEGN